MMLKKKVQQLLAACLAIVIMGVPVLTAIAETDTVYSEPIYLEGSRQESGSKEREAGASAGLQSLPEPASVADEQVTVSFYVGDELYLAESIDANTLARQPQDPDPQAGEGHFVGWFVGDASSPFDFYTIVEEDLALTARFSEQYLVQFLDARGSVASVSWVDEGDTVTPYDSDALTISADKQFIHWYAEGEDPEVPFDFSQGIESNLRLRPYLKDTLLLVFVSEGTQVPPQVINPQEKVTLPDNAEMTRPGYAFRYWSRERNGTTAYVPDYETASLTLYAVWEKQKVTYSVIYWKEKPNIEGVPTLPEDYMYAYTRVANDAYAGDVIQMDDAKAKTLLGSTAADATYIKTHFEYVQADQGIVALGDGSAVVNVYYSRKTYQVTFEFNSGTTASTLGASAFRLFNDTEDRPLSVGNSTYVMNVKLDQKIFEIWPYSITLSSDKPFALWGGWYSLTQDRAATFSETMYTTFTVDLKKYNFKLPASYNKMPDFVTRMYYLEVAEMPDAATLAAGIASGKYEWFTYQNVNRLYEYRPEYTTGYQQTGTVPTGYKGWPGKSLPGFRSANTTRNGDHQLYPITLYDENGVQLKNELGQNLFDLHYYMDRLSYKITWNAMGGKLKDGKETGVAATILFEAPVPDAVFEEVPTKENATFVGWYYDQGFTEPAVPGIRMPGYDLVMYAKYESTGVTVTFYESEDAASPMAVKATSPGGLVSYPDNNFTVGETYEGLGVFKGWSFYVSGIPAEFSDTMPIATDMAVYAQWEGISHTVTYYVDNAGSEVLETQQVLATAGQDTLAKHQLYTPIPSTPAGYGFLGWYTDPAGSAGTRFTAGTPITGDLEVYPVFAEPLTIKSMADTLYSNTNEAKAVDGVLYWGTGLTQESILAAAAIDVSTGHSNVTVRSIRVDVGDKTLYPPTQATKDALAAADAYPLTVTVTDSIGRTVRAPLTLYVWDDTAPEVGGEREAIQPVGIGAQTEQAVFDELIGEAALSDDYATARQLYESLRVSDTDVDFAEAGTYFIEYTVTDTVGNETKVRVELTIYQPYTDVDVIKVWEDDENALGGRPADVRIQLYRNTPGNQPEPVEAPATITGGSTDAEWIYSYGALLACDNKGVAYVYSVEELDTHPNYTASYDGLTITNALQTIAVDGEKVWNILGSGYTRPDDVTIELYRSDAPAQVFDTTQVSGTGDAWAFSFDGLLAYDAAGNEYTYTVREAESEIPAYIESSVLDTTITNTYAADESITVRAEWDHTGAPQSMRPDEVTLLLLRDGVEYARATVAAGDAWQASFTVPRIDYVDSTFTLEQEAVNQYATAYDEEDGILVARNAFIMPMLEISGSKQWSGTPDGYQAPSVIVDLQRDGEDAGQSLQIVSGQQDFTFPQEVPQYNDDGEAYEYTVKERKVPAYDTGADDTGLHLTNTYNPVRTSYDVVGEKAVTGVGAPDEVFAFIMTARDADQPMPAGSADGELTVTAKAGAILFGSIAFPLPGEYVYEIREVSGDTRGFDYDEEVFTLTITVIDDGEGNLVADASLEADIATAPQGIVFTNAYTIPSDDVVVTKVWADDSDALGVRPDSVEMQLERTPAGGQAETVETRVVVGTGDSWTETFADMPVHDTLGRAYTYSARELNTSPNYSAEANGLTVTNTIQPTSVTLTKAWNIIGTGFEMPDAVTFELWRTPAGGTAERVLEDVAVSGDSLSEPWTEAIHNLPAYDKDGSLYTYTAQEPNPPFATTAAASGLTVTNTYAADQEISVAKTWNHTGSPSHPASVTVTLHRNGEAAAYDSVELNEANGWSHTFAVPQKDYLGADFAVQEAEISDYSATISGDAENGFTIHNEYVMPKVSVSGTKTWVGIPDSGVSKPSVIISLHRSDDPSQVLHSMLLADDAYRFSGLDQYDPQGQPYVYTVSESETPGFDQRQDGLDFTNTYAPASAYVPVSGEKQVRGDTGYPETSFEFVLTRLTAGAPMPEDAAGDTATVTAGEGAFTFGSIAYTVPGTYVYRIQETVPAAADAVEGFTYDTAVYELSVTVTFADGVLSTETALTKDGTAASEILFANKYVTPTRDLTITKVWADDGDALGVRPDSVELVLERTPEDGGREDVESRMAAGTGDSWAETFADMPVHDTLGRAYTYSVRELNASPNYVTVVDGMTVTNTLQPISVTLTKAWDIVGTGFELPDDVEIDLYRAAGGVETHVDSYTLTDADDWTLEVSNLPAYDKDGNLYTYTAQEPNPPFATTAAASGLTVTNTYAADQEISVTKTWDHTGSPSHPASVTVTLHRNGEAAAYDSVELSEANGWKHTFAVRQKDYLGATFTVQEAEISDYSTVISGDAENGFTIHNEYVMPKVSVSGTKTWVGIPDSGVSKPSVIISLHRSDDPSRVLDSMLLADDAYRFSGLDQYDPQGQPYVYTVSESATPGFDQRQDGLDFTNTYAPASAYVPVSGEKQVRGDAGYPAQGFEFMLTRLTAGAPMPGGAAGDAVSVTAGEGAFSFGSIAYTVPGTYVYQIQETAEDAEGFDYDAAVYELSVTVTFADGVLSTETTLTKDGAAASDILFTNGYATPTRAITVTKVWADDSNALGVRPDSVELVLERTPAGGGKEDVGSRVVTGTGDSWTETFADMPVHDAQGRAYTYSARELNTSPNYLSEANGLTVTNTLQPISVTLTKAWDIVGTGFELPDDVEIDLYRAAGGVEARVGSYTLTGVNTDDWTLEVSNLPAYDRDGNLYTYTAQEPNPPFATTAAASGLTVTNTYAADQEISVKKTWNHTGSPSHPASVTITLHRNGEAAAYDSVKLSEANGWSHTFAVPQKDYLGASFEVREAAVNGYAAVISGDAENGFVVHNEYVMPKDTVSGTKTWVGIPDSGVSKPAVIISLYRSDDPSKALDSVLLTDDAYRFTGLDRYDPQGQPYVYTVSESATPGFDQRQDGLNFTNTYAPEGAYVPVSGAKQIQGDAGYPAEGFEFVLTRLTAGAPMPGGAAGNTATVTAGEGAFTFGSISYAVPGTYVYRIQETLPAVADAVEGFTYDAAVYELTVTVTFVDGVLSTETTLTKDGAAASEILFTNGYATPTRDITVTKVWADDRDALDVRPDSVELMLERTPAGGGKEDVASRVVTGTGDSWTETFADMPVHDTLGRAYTYSARELNTSPNYSAEANGLTVTNTIQPTEVTLTKVWDIVGTGFEMPDAVTFELWRTPAGGTAERVLEDVAVSGDSLAQPWTETVSNLPAYDKDGSLYTYTAREPNPPFATTAAASGLTVTNTYAADQEISVTKTWNHTGSPSHPASVTITLHRNGEAAAYDSVELSEANGWRHTFEVPQKDYLGAAFEVKEAEVSGYSTTISGDPENGFVVHNEYVMPKDTVSGTKTWVGIPDSGVSKPAVIISLYRSDDPAQALDNTLLTDDAYGFTGLDRYDPQGQPYVYTVSESATPGFDQRQDGLNFTNTYAPANTYVPVNGQKRVQGDAGYPAVGFEFVLTRLTTGAPMPGGAAGDTVSVTAGEGAFTFGSIAYTVPGTYVYRIQETTPAVADAVEGFTYDAAVYELSVTVTFADGVLSTETALTKDGAAASEILFTNEYVTPTRDLTITKVWADDGDALGVRPDSVELVLERTPAGGGKEDVASRVVTGTGDSWAETFADMPVHDTLGRAYTYSARELSTSPNYVSIADGLTVTNTLQPTEVTLTKVWDIVGTGFEMPDAVHFELWRTPAGGTAERVLEDVAVSGDLLNEPWTEILSNLPAYDKDGNLYTYTAQEPNPPFATTASASGLTVTNTYAADQEISVAKTWNHTGSPSHPASVTVTLHRNGEAEPYDSVELSEANGWHHTFEVPQKDYLGASFEVREAEVSGYSTTISGDPENGFVVHNEYVMPKDTVSGTKTWVGIPDSGVSKPTVIISLYRSDDPAQALDSVLLTDDAYGFTGLDRYDPQGQPYVYTVSESATPGFDQQQDGLDFTNTYAPANTYVPVNGEKQVWGDTGYPETSFEFVLTRLTAGAPMTEDAAGDTVTVAAGEGAFTFGNITYTVPGTYVYRIQETVPAAADAVEGFAYDIAVYELTVTVTFADGVLSTETALTRNGVAATAILFTNGYITPTRAITVTKVWADDSDALGVRPDSVELMLERTPMGGGKEDVASRVVTGTGDSWAETFADMPVHDTLGRAYTYSARELNTSPNYLSEANGLTVTNTVQPISVTLTKVWDIVGTGFEMPDAVHFELWRTPAGGTAERVLEDVPVSGESLAQPWTKIISNLPAYDKDGNLYTYTVQEPNPPFAITAVAGGLTVTNTYAADAEIEITKQWDTTGAPADQRPDQVTVELYRTGAEGTALYQAVTLRADEGWNAVIAVPQVDYLNASFSLEELEVEGYSSHITGNALDGFVVSNAFVMPLDSISGTKAWLNVPGIVTVPAVAISLWRSDDAVTPYQTYTLQPGADSYEFTGLPRYDEDGNAYLYTVEEVTPPGYVSEKSGEADFVNTYAPKSIGFVATAQKTIPGDTGFPATDFAFTMKAIGEGEAHPMPSGSVNGVKTVHRTGEGALDFGEMTFIRPGEYLYEVAEVIPADAEKTEGFAYDVTRYELALTVRDEGDGTLSVNPAYRIQDGAAVNGFVFENVYTTPTRDIDVEIRWVDQDDILSLRPEEAKLQLQRTVEGGVPENVNGPVTLRGDTNLWLHTFQDMPAHDAAGNAYTYTILALDVDARYTADVEGFILTNTLKQARVTGTKEASPAPAAEGTIPVVNAGDTLTYRITLQNTGDRNVYDTRVMDTLPAGVTLQAADVTPAPDASITGLDGSTTLMWLIPEIVQGGSLTIEIPVTADALAEGERSRLMENTAYYRLPERAGENLPLIPGVADAPAGYTATNTVAHQLITLEQKADVAEGAYLAEGRQVQYTLTLYNAAAMAGIEVWDILPDGMSLVPDSISSSLHPEASDAFYSNGILTFPRVAVPAGGATFAFRGAVDKLSEVLMSRPLTNRASANATVSAGAPAVNPAIGPITHTATRREVSIDLTARLYNGDTAETWMAGTLENPVPTALGQTIEYRLTLYSAGYLPEGDVLVTETLEPGMTFVEGSTQVLEAGSSTSVTPSQSGGDLRWVISGLSADETVVFTFQAIAPATTGEGTVRDLVGQATEEDLGLGALTTYAGSPVYTDVAQLSSQSGLTVHRLAIPHVETAKRAEPAGEDGKVVALEAGDIITYSIRVRNTGHAEAQHVRVMDILPEGLSLVQGSLLANGEALTGGKAKTLSSGMRITPYVITDNGQTALYWIIDTMEGAEALTNQGMEAVTLSFEAAVADTGKGLAIANTAYTRVPDANEPAPAQPSGVEDPADYTPSPSSEKHQTFTFTAAANPAGGVDEASAANVAEGGAVTYTLTLDAGAALDGVVVRDTMPGDMTLVPGSIRMVRPDGTVQSIPDSALVAGIITWPEASVAAGQTRFEYTVLVDKLPEGTMARTYRNEAQVSLSNGASGAGRNTLTRQANDLFHRTDTGFSTIVKSAALLNEQGVLQTVENGTQDAPVIVQRGQQVTFTMVVDRTAAPGNRSGNLVITDTLPAGMTLVPGSIQGTVSGGQGQVVSAQLVRNSVEWVLQGLADGESATLSFTAEVAASSASVSGGYRDFVNEATLLDTALESLTYAQSVAGHAAGSQVYEAAQYALTSNQTFHRVQFPALTAVKRASVAEGRLRAEDRMTYTISITNQGQGDALQVLVRDRIPDGLTYVDGSITADVQDAAMEIRTIDDALYATWVLPTIAAGQQVNLTFGVRVQGMDEDQSFIRYQNIAQYRQADGAVALAAQLDSSAGFMDTNRVTHYQLVGGEILVRKMAADTKALLPGATFTLVQLSAVEPENRWSTPSEAVSGYDGIAVFSDLPAGEYVLYESEAPKDYLVSTIRRSINISGGEQRTVTISDRPDSGVLGEVDEELIGIGNRNVGLCKR